ncbi:MAG: tRNA 2-thiouridine(34) synthase MnmA [Anaerolineae bacterium]
MMTKANNGKRAVVAMSGGVDSAMAAALLVEQGYEVMGIMMRLWADDTSPAGPAENRCCTPQGVEDARRVAQTLGIPFYLLNFEREFKAWVVNYFCREYASGRTPNPCLACNRHIRFRFLLQRALALGADYLATGHYARVRCQDGRYELLKGVDARKDQSYVLYMLGQEQLRHLLLPVGDYTKDQIRAMAQERGLLVADKPESQEICFLADGDYRAFLRRHVPQAIVPGPILDPSGRVLGQHQGLPFYTIGQRRGLGLAVGEPLYVLDLDKARNALIVGPGSALGRRELIASQVSFVAGETPSAPLAVTAKIRYKAVEAEATVIPLGDSRVRVTFARPLRDITPGQGVVFYQGEVVLGGGIIEEAR